MIQIWATVVSLLIIGWVFLSLILSIVGPQILGTLVFLAVFPGTPFLYFINLLKKEGNHETNTSVRSR